MASQRTTVQLLRAARAAAPVARSRAFGNTATSSSSSSALLRPTHNLQAARLSQKPTSVNTLRWSSSSTSPSPGAATGSSSSTSSYSPPPSPKLTTDPVAPVATCDFDTINRLSSSISTAAPSTLSAEGWPLLIDVREPFEIESTGRIPGAINVPIDSSPDGWFLPADEFEDRFGMEKPATGHGVVFYCRSGVRSKAAARVARMAGYENISEYPGSWNEWSAKGGKIER